MVFCRVLNHGGAGRVQVHVGESGEKVMTVQNARVEAGLPEPAFAVEACVEVLRVLAGNPLHEAGGGVRALRREDEV